MCAYCGLWANACAALIMWVHGLEVGPSWDRPWLQSSLSDFWARRWNLPASASLKHLVYDPIVEGACSNHHNQGSHDLLVPGCCVRRRPAVVPLQLMDLARRKMPCCLPPACLLAHLVLMLLLASRCP